MAKRRPAGRGEDLNEKYRIGAAHALFSKDGTFYMELDRFPGALIDKNGFVLFKKDSDYKNAIDSGQLYRSKPTKRDGKCRIKVPKGGIYAMLGYTTYFHHLVSLDSDLSASDIEIVKEWLQRRFAPHRIAALFDVDQSVINGIARNRNTARQAKSTD